MARGPTLKGAPDLPRSLAQRATGTYSADTVSANVQSAVFPMTWYTLSLLQDADGAHPRLTLPG